MTLKPCPKCGAEPIVREYTEGAIIECPRCHTAIVRHIGTLAAAVEAWEKLKPDKRCAVCAARGAACEKCIQHDRYVCGE